MEKVTAPKALHWGVAALLVGLWACQSGGGTTGEGETDGDALEYDGGPLLASVGEQVMRPSTAAFASSVDGLVTATAAYADARASNAADTDAKLQAARDAWGTAMATWQVLETLQLGPAGAAADVVGGSDLRDEIYSWPTVNTCRIDQELVAGEYAQDDFTANRLVNVYGLDAIEYLLFYDGEQNTCAPQIDINAEGSWDGLGADELAVRRANYAAAIADDLVAHANTLTAAWADGGEFAVALASPGEGSAYRTQTEALDELIRAMFYVDQQLKDVKLARPAGISECGGATCIDELESKWARYSKQHAVANLRGYRMMFLGGETPEAGKGFDDLLRELGEDALADQALADIDAAIAAVEAVPGTFAEALTGDDAALDDAHAKVKAVTDLLKGDLVTLLTLHVPSEAAGDAD